MSWDGEMIGEPLAGEKTLLLDSITSLDLRLVGEGQVDGHLVAVEVGVEAATDERVQTDRVAFDELRLEGLDAHGAGSARRPRGGPDDLEDVPHVVVARSSMRLADLIVSSSP